MDLVKIGRYIAENRKKLGMTQKQLAEQLGMSDKSVSKWERGICLPDVSVYGDLCRILGISINAFLAGEDISQENAIQKSEENILCVAVDSQKKQKRLKGIIWVLAAVSCLLVLGAAFWAYQKVKPRNYLEPASWDGIEMQTAQLFTGPDGAHIYQFTTTDEYRAFRLYLSEIQSGRLIQKDVLLELGFDGIGSPENGVILLYADFQNFTAHVVFSAEGTQLKTEIPILENVENRTYYLRSASGIQESIGISYGDEQPLMALVYDQNLLSAYDIYEIAAGNPADLAENDYMYYFSFEFSKES